MPGQHPLSVAPAAPRRMPCAPSRGHSLLEMLVVVAVVLLLCASVLTNWRQQLAQQAVEATAALLETDLRYARAMALAREASVRVEVQRRDDGSTCYLMHNGPAGSCRCLAGGVASCTAGVHSLRVAEQPARSGVQVVHSGRALTFDPSKGTVSPTATLVVRGADGRSIHQIVNLMGRTRSCSPDRLGGLRPCA